MEYMKHSFKPMLYTMLPLLIIFGWLNAYYNYEPLRPDAPFNVSIATQELTGTEVTLEAFPELKLGSDAKQKIEKEQATWTLQGNEGEYKLVFKQDKEIGEKIVLITNERKYHNPIETPKNSPIKRILVHHAELKPWGNLSLLGWEPGWIGTYIIFSIALSSLLRKVMKVY